MIQTVPFDSSSSLSSFLVNWSRSSSSSRTIRCSSRNNAYIPKLEPFSRSKIDRAFKEPPLIQKSETQLADYCSTLEGDESYSCWRAYFELKQLEEEVPKEELERLIIEAGGVKSLVGCLHGVAEIHKAKKECKESLKHATAKNADTVPCPIPDGLPKTFDELEEEEKARMPDSPFTRLLRARGRYPAWYSPVPDHETD
ncbi:CCG-binding protein 1-like [Olea europaea var. sylvestris]|uniref:CCG-binding 1 n=1 Tax=Olea europaea subsp. europaea TaxID=158383 RepID=A0A8S0UIK5_OLEEU|nr:CCG-binding protein 1-like [Olea europaea var. sylvestris]CAA3017284.1 CCG-binding 1 [Olea europaea subsp. europaea]